MFLIAYNSFVGTAVDYEEELISPDELRQSKSDKIKVIMGTVEDKSIRTTEGSKSSSSIGRYFVVQRSSIREVNGRFVKKSYFLSGNYCLIKILLILF